MTDLPDSCQGSAPLRRQLAGVWGELLLALPPTLVVLGAFALVGALRHERVLFASLASSAFLIDRDPAHPMNGARPMVVGQLCGVACGSLALVALGPGYLAAGVAMAATIAALVLGDSVHPPAVSTALGFAFYSGQVGTAGRFVLALALLVVLLGVQRLAAWGLARATRRARRPHPGSGRGER